MPVRGGEGSPAQTKPTPRQRRDRAARRRAAREPVKPLPVEAVAPLLARVTAPPEPAPVRRAHTRARQITEKAVEHGLTPRQSQAALSRIGFRGAAALANALEAERTTRLAAAGRDVVRTLTPGQEAEQRALPKLSRDQQLQTAVAIAMRGLEPITRQAYKPSVLGTAALSLLPELVTGTKKGGWRYEPGEGYRWVSLEQAVDPMIAPWPGPLGRSAKVLAAAERAGAEAIGPRAAGPWGRYVRTRPPERVFKGPNVGQEVRVPAAGSRIGRGFERTLDVSRARLSPITGGLVKTEEGKFFKVSGEQQQMITRRKNVGSRVLRRLDRRWGVRKMPVEEAYALQAYATNTPPELWAAAHERWAGETKDAVERLFNKKHADYFRTVGDELLDVSGPSVEFAATPQGERLAGMYAEMERAIGSREQLGRGFEQLTDEKIASGINAPGRIARGAKWVEPTPGRQGKSKALDTATAYRDRVRAAVGRSEERVTRIETFERARTPQEAKARLAELDRQHEALVERTARDMGLLTPEGKLSADQLREVSRRNVIVGKQRKGQAKAQRKGQQQSVRDEVLAQAEDELYKTAEAHPDVPAIVKFRAAVEERAALRAQLENPETMFEAGPPRRLELGTVTEQRLPFDKYARKQLAGREVLTAEEQASRQAMAADIRDDLRPLEKRFRALQEEWNQPATTELEKRADINRLLRDANDAEKKIVRYAQKAEIEPEYLRSAEQLRADAEALTDEIADLRGQSSPELRDARRLINKLRGDLRDLERPVAVRVGDRILTPEGKLLEPKGYQRLQRQRSALSEADLRVKQLEEAAARREEPVGLVGAEDFVSGRLYTHTQPGAPGLRVRVYASMRDRMPRRRGTKLPNNPRFDPRMRKAMTGRLLRSGRYRVDPLGSTAQALETAVRMDHFHRSLAVIQDSATKTARSEFDMVVVLDPVRFAEAYPDSFVASQQGKAVHDLYADLDVLATTNGKEFRRQMLGNTDRRTVDQLRDTLFPSDMGNITVGTEIPGAGFVNPGAVNEMGIFHLPEDQLRWSTLFSQLGHSKVVDLKFLRVINSFSRTVLLYLNPAYITVNLAGNGFLNLFQQGVFLPRNLGRASYASVKMDKHALYAMDALMGEGLTASVGPASRLADIISAFVDRIPRRMSFIHEAHRQGYKTTADLERLLAGGHETDLALIRRRAVNAIVDYERLSPFEKNVVTNVLAFYPWTKGAISYSIRFPLEHPYQALAIAAVGFWQDERADKMLGDERPPWMQFALPVATGSDGRPIVVNLGSLLPFTTPVQMGETVYGFARGDPQWGNVTGLLSPGVSQLVEAGTGTTGIGTPAPYGAPAAGKGLFEMIAPVRLARQGDPSRVALGSLNPEVYSWAGRRKRDELVSDSRHAGLGEPPREVMAAFEARARVDQAVKPETTYIGKLRKAAAVYKAITGDGSYVRDAEQVEYEDDARDIYLSLRDELTWPIKNWEQDLDAEQEAALG